MSAILTFILGPLGRWLLVALGALGAHFAVRRGAYDAGRAAARAETQHAQLEETKHALDTRAAAAQAGAGLPDPAVDDWLRRPADRHAGPAQR